MVRGVAAIAIVLLSGCSESERRDMPSSGAGTEGGGGVAGSAGEGAGAGGAGGADVAGSGARAGGGASPGAGAHAGSAAASAGAGARAGGGGATADAGAEAGGSGGEAPAVRIVRGAPDQEFWDLTIRGEGLDEYEGKIARVRLGQAGHPPERLGSGEAKIEDSAFELAFPKVWEMTLYKAKRLYIDVDGDGMCDHARDRVFADFRADHGSGELVVREPSSSANDEFSAMSHQSDCDELNAPWPEK